MHLFNKVLQHFLGDLEISDNTVFERTDSGNITWRAPQHSLSINTHGFDNFLPQMVANSDNRWFIQNNAFVSNINQSICSTQIDGKIAGKKAADFL